MLRSTIDKLKKRREESTENLLAEIDPNRLPNHIAIIMDGNGRWANKRGLPRPAGHRAGVESLRDVVKACSSLGVKYLTVYAFSTENWKRPDEEVSILMNLLVEYLRKELEELNKNSVVVKAIGRIDGLPQRAQEELLKAQQNTCNNTGLILNLALNYGGRVEIIDAVKQLLEEKFDSENLSEDIFNSYLYTAGQPDTDLVIRPSGELRISNFLLWQSAYAEFWFTDCLWPDFRRKHLYEAIISFQQRNRRYGGLNA